MANTNIPVAKNGRKYLLNLPLMVHLGIKTYQKHDCNHCEKHLESPHRFRSPIRCAAIAFNPFNPAIIHMDNAAPKAEDTTIVSHENARPIFLNRHSSNEF